MVLRQLGKQISGAGHFVQMLAQFYYRVGLYKDSLHTNLDVINYRNAKLQMLVVTRNSLSM